MYLRIEILEFDVSVGFGAIESNATHNNKRMLKADSDEDCMMTF